MPIVKKCMNNPESFVKQIVMEGFYPLLGYRVDIDFVLSQASVNRRRSRQAVL